MKTSESPNKAHYGKEVCPADIKKGGIGGFAQKNPDQRNPASFLPAFLLSGLTWLRSHLWIPRFLAEAGEIEEGVS